MYGIILGLKILITILLAAVVIIILLLSIPYTYTIEGSISEKFKGKFEASCFLGLLRFTCVKLSDEFDVKINFIGFYVYSKKTKNNYGDTENKVNVNSKIRVDLKMLNSKILRELFQYLKDIISILQPNTFNINGVYGLEDPFATGSISAVVSILKSNFTDLKIEVYPVFDDVILDISLQIKGSINLLSIVFKTMKLLFNRDLKKILLKKA